MSDFEIISLPHFGGNGVRERERATGTEEGLCSTAPLDDRGQTPPEVMNQDYYIIICLTRPE